MKNNKGLSTVVTTLIIILLVLVAVGIIWGVVNNLLTKSKSNINANTRCMDIDIKATKVLDNGDGTFNVTLSRTSTGEAVDGVKAVIYNNESLNTEVLDIAYAVNPLDNVVKVTTASTNFPTGFTGTLIKKIEVTPYFTDDSGVEVLCPVTATKEF
jgi:hypothetical protein